MVDVGDQKTSVSCVEDGVSHPDTRIHLDYGGSDLSQVFYYLLRNVGFSYKECDPTGNRLDAELLHKLKEENCHLDLDQCGLLETQFTVVKRSQQHTLYLGDDRIIAASALFHTDLLALTGMRKSVRFMGKDPGDPEDPHDHIYLSETSRKYNKARKKKRSHSLRARGRHLICITIMYLLPLCILACVF